MYLDPFRWLRVLPFLFLFVFDGDRCRKLYVTFVCKDFVQKFFFFNVHVFSPKSWVQRHVHHLKFRCKDMNTKNCLWIKFRSLHPKRKKINLVFFSRNFFLGNVFYVPNSENPNYWIIKMVFEGFTTL